MLVRSLEILSVINFRSHNLLASKRCIPHMTTLKSVTLTARRKISASSLPSLYSNRRSASSRFFSFYTAAASLLFLPQRGSSAFTSQTRFPFASAATNRQQNRAMSCSKTHVTERDGSGTITVSPRKEMEQSGLVVISHGLGDTAEGFADVAEQFASQMPWLKLILPTAPTQKVTMNMGMAMPSWYDIVGLDERSNENCAGIEESRARIAGILQKEHESTGLPYSR